MFLFCDRFLQVSVVFGTFGMPLFLLYPFFLKPLFITLGSVVMGLIALYLL